MKIKARIHFFAHSVCWQNSLLMLIRLSFLIPISFLICEPFPASRGDPHPLVHGLFLHLQSQQWWVKSFSCFKSLLLLFLLSHSLTLLLCFSNFKSPCDVMGPPK